MIRPSRLQPIRHKRRAIVAVETALVMPLLILFLAGVWEVGRLVEVKQLVNNATREAGRQASSGRKDYTGVSTTALNYLEKSGINTTGASVLVESLTGSAGSDPTQAVQLDRFRITVSIPFNNVRWVLLPMITDATTITSSSDWYSMKDLPVVVSDVIPVE
jgi:Flp pilus assembly protein TadG